MTDHDEFLDELRQRANRAHGNRQDAGAPPDGLWASVLASQQSEIISRKEPTMTHSIATVGPVGSPAHAGSIARYTNIAATIALVATLALGGWFAAMNLRGNNDPVPHWAAQPSTPVLAQTCDVEPLSVDRVMEIVKNPFMFLQNGPAGDPVSIANPTNPWSGELYEARYWEVNAAFQGSANQPTEDQFNQAGGLADQYLQCLTYGTRGQAWTFYSPIHIQNEVLSWFEVFATEDVVRTTVESFITQPYTLTEALVADYQPQSVHINPDIKLALVYRTDNPLFPEILSIGVTLLDSDGEELFLSSATGNQIIPAATGNRNYLKLNIARYSDTDTWYVVPYWWAP